jgi:hypothetical protein
MKNRFSKRRRLPPPPPDPPPGYMYYYRTLTRISTVERLAKKVMRGFDKLPRSQRDALNYGSDEEDR